MSDTPSEPAAETVVPAAAPTSESADGTKTAIAAVEAAKDPPLSTDVSRKRGGGIGDIFLPNRALSGGTARVLICFQVLLGLLIWISSPWPVLPTPMDALAALRNLWLHEGLAQELIVSFKLNLEALGLSTLISLGLAYLTVIPFFRPMVVALSKARFLSLAGFTFVFTLMVGGGHPLKVALLVFGMTAFYLTSMAAVVTAIPKSDFDHARTLRMGEWRVTWEVVVLGTLDKAWEVLRQNAAIGWMMLTMVEGISRSEGGVGAMILNQSKHFRLAEVFAIQIVILVVGLGQDYAIGVLRRFCCPYADLTLERR
jgi:NitT/TauT family transport system permease protein